MTASEPTPELITRRLAAVLAADVEGYSRHIGRDDVAAMRMLMARRESAREIIIEHRGRTIDTAGDSILAEFASVVDAVACALEIQKANGEAQRDLAPDQRMNLRIGIHIGDVVVRGSELFGDGVNTAARLQALAQPGGVCASGAVLEQVRRKLPIRATDLGLQTVKNIADPISVFRIERAEAGVPDTRSQPAARMRRWRKRGVIAAATAAALSAIAIGGFISVRDRFRAPSTPIVRPAAVSAMPIIAVLPFANQTGDDAQDYFADGVTEEVINALGRFNTLRVIGRNAVLRYRKSAPTREEIVSELGANYLVTGSMRRSGDRVRIAAQLTESRAGTVMWSDRYDGELTDIFEFQDAIARRIAGTLAANIAQVEGQRSLDQPTRNPNAFDLVLRARALGHASTRTANRRFRELIAEAIKLDPNYAMARALMAEALYSQAVLGWTEFTDRELSRGVDEARKAIALAPDEPDGYRALGRILLARAEYDQAQNALKRAVEINPSDANALAAWGTVQSFSGQIAEAIEPLELGLKLDPMLDPSYVFDLAVAYYLARRHEDVLRLAERALARYPDFAMFNVPAAAAAAQLGRKEQAARYVEALRRRLPGLDLNSLGSRFKNPAHPAYLREGLKLAGV